MKTPPPNAIFAESSILSRVKEGYLLWMNIVPHMPKGSRYTIGSRIENKFLDLLELSYISYFTLRENKTEKLSQCILLNDLLKFLIAVSWEGRLITNQECEQISVKLEEIGKMFGGWKQSLNNPEKKNRQL